MSIWRLAEDRLARGIGLEITHSQVRYYRALLRCVHSGSRWLDVGCGRQIVPDFAATLDQQREMVSRIGLLVGMDVDAAIHDHPLLQARVMGWGDALPFADASFDLITANMVMEHVKEPTRILAEVRRVLRPGGWFLFHTPNFKYYQIFIASLIPDFIKRRIIWLFERRDEEDVFRTYYRSNTSGRVRRLAAQCGFEVKEVEVGGSIGSFRSLGPVGLLEVFILKLLSWRMFQDFNATLIAVLMKPANECLMIPLPDHTPAAERKQYAKERGRVDHR
jgi:ubiquinone/menaquinone biosynthesis C-methylase UbiE